MASLGRRAHGAGNKIRYFIDFSDFLEGAEATLSGCTVGLAVPVAGVSITGVTIVPDRAFFWLEGGSDSEIFTVNVVGTDSRGEVVNHTIEFYIVAP